jgi:hypothetical protein
MDTSHLKATSSQLGPLDYRHPYPRSPPDGTVGDQIIVAIGDDTRLLVIAIGTSSTEIRAAFRAQLVRKSDGRRSHCIARRTTTIAPSNSSRLRSVGRGRPRDPECNQARLGWPDR